MLLYIVAEPAARILLIVSRAYRLVRFSGAKQQKQRIVTEKDKLFKVEIFSTLTSPKVISPKLLIAFAGFFGEHSAPFNSMSQHELARSCGLRLESSSVLHFNR